MNVCLCACAFEIVHIVNICQFARYNTDRATFVHYVFCAAFIIFASELCMNALN